MGLGPCFEVYKNVGEKPAHPLRNYWKNSFVLCKTYWCFHLTQACRSTLLNSFHDASKVPNSERFVFKTTPFVLVWSTTTFRPRHSLIYCQLTKATLRGLALFHFAHRGGRTTFNRQSGCCEIRCSRPPEARYFRILLEVLRNGAGFRWAADSSSSSTCKAK